MKNDKVFLDTWGIIALDINTGKRECQYHPGYEGYPEVSFSAGSNKIVYGNSDGEYRALSTRNGRVLWEFKTNSEVPFRNALFADEKVFVRPHNNTLYALNDSTGVLWEQKAVEARPTIYHDKIFVGCLKGLCALNINTGKQIWKSKEAGNIYIIDNQIFGIGNNTLNLLDEKTGRIVQKYKLPAYVTYVKGLIRSDNQLIFWTGDGTIFSAASFL